MTTVCLYVMEEQRKRECGTILPEVFEVTYNVAQQSLDGVLLLNLI